MKYGVRLQGENYELEIDGKKKPFGFITTIFVKAKTVEEAEIAAVNLVRNDVLLNGLMISGSPYISTLRSTEIWEERWWKRLGGKGYSFFPMEKDNEI
ncbi:hypothetical protein [Microbulbifer discodermiae]|uniref:hypothetical protein n=1 Tax=Microbulbifer sp. 2201CG32-9 TaxID=3232309 RepID=UPI00345BA19A